MSATKISVWQRYIYIYANSYGCDSVCAVLDRSISCICRAIVWAFHMLFASNFFIRIKLVAFDSMPHDIHLPIHCQDFSLHHRILSLCVSLRSSAVCVSHVHIFHLLEKLFVFLAQICIHSAAPKQEKMRSTDEEKHRWRAWKSDQKIGVGFADVTVFQNKSFRAISITVHYQFGRWSKQSSRGNICAWMSHSLKYIE